MYWYGPLTRYVKLRVAHVPGMPGTFYQQLYEYFKHVLSDLLSAFRKRYGCQRVLTKLIEDSKRALDNHMHVGLLLLDLSKAFDCLPHRLLICKLNAYDVSRESCSLMLSYLKDRLQRVKISAAKSDWLTGKMIEKKWVAIYLNIDESNDRT